MRLTEKSVVRTLRHHGYRLTPQRRVIIKAITSTRGSLTPAAIYGRVHQVRPDIGLVTVYRTLEILAKLGLICEVRTAADYRSYTVGAIGHHHHLICSNCGVVVDFTCDLEKVQQQLSRESGFQIDGHMLEFTGLCQACQKKRGRRLTAVAG